MVHDYQLYTLPGMVRRRGPTRSCTTSCTSRGRSRTPGACCPTRIRDEIYDGPARQRHHRLPHALLPAQLPAVLPRPARARGRHGARRRPLRRPRGLGARLPAADRLAGDAGGRASATRVREFEERAAAAPARVLDPARRPRGPVQERPARVHRLRHLPRAAPGVHRADHLHRAAHAVADRRARVRGVPRADRGAGRGRQPPARDAGLDADRPQAARRPRRGGRVLQALRRDDGQRDVRRHEPRGEGGPARQRARRRLDPEREHGRARGARASSRCR